MSLIANTPKPPYYAVIFTSYRTEGDNGYDKTADRMVELAAEQPGFLGIKIPRIKFNLVLDQETGKSKGFAVVEIPNENQPKASFN